jgi:hypothetical protein
METWLTMLIGDIVAERMETAQRHRLLMDVLAPLGPVEADAMSAAIEEPAYWVRHSNHQTGADRDLADAVHTAVSAVQATFVPGVAA